MSIILYQDNIKSAEAEIKNLEKLINRNAIFRLLIIVGGGLFIYQLFKTDNVLYVLLAIISIMLGFVYLIFRQSRVERKLEEAKIILQINQNELSIIQGGDNMYPDGSDFEDAKHPYSSDLDVFGKNSLFALINRCATKDAIRLLANWFSGASEKLHIMQRQDAVSELKEDVKHLQSFQSKMLFNLNSIINLRSYLHSYFHDQTFQFKNAFMAFYVPIVPYLFLIGMLISIFAYNLSNYLIGLAIIHLLWTLSQGAKVGQFSNKIDKIGASLIGLAEGIQLIEDKTYQSKLNQNLQAQLKVSSSEKKLSSIIHDLGKLIDKLDARNNMLVGAILNMLFLWDFKQVMAISAWKNQYEENILSGFDALSNYECLVSLSILAYNHPEWSTPELFDEVEKDRIHAEDIAHPLIKKDRSISNDYEAKGHQIALITGSNMAGKSTFLRSLGANAVLAYAGAVVAAKSFKLPIYDLISYMRIKDSLNESTSTFKAELDRMKFILDHVASNKSSFFLIDEMLRGTNSVDKYLGSKAIIKKLIRMNGKGLLATHDLQLSELAQEYPSMLKNYHFDIQVIDEHMLFDYKLKEGPCTIFNASMLLKGIGVEIEK